MEPIGFVVIHLDMPGPLDKVSYSRVGGDSILFTVRRMAGEGARLFRCSYRNRLLQFNLNFWQRVTEGTWELGRHSKQAQRVM